MKGKKGIALELVQERGECKCRRSSSVRRSFTSRLFVLLLLAVVVGTVCGLSRLDAASTIFSAFTIGFCTVPFLKRGGGLKQQELGEPGSLEGEKGTTLLDFKLEDDFVELFNALDRVSKPLPEYELSRPGFYQGVLAAWPTLTDRSGAVQGTESQVWTTSEARSEWFVPTPITSLFLVKRT